MSKCKRLDFYSMQPKRILFPFVGDTVGGSHLSALDLIVSMDRGSYQPVVSIHEGGRLAEYLADRGIPFVKAPTVSYARGGGSLVAGLGKAVSSAFPLARFLRLNTIDIVHTNDNRMHLTWAIACGLAGSKFVWHQRSAFQTRRLGFYARFSDRILTISEYCRSSLIGYMRRRAQVVEDPFAIRFPSLDKRLQRKFLLKEMGVSEVANVVGFVSNFTEQKRPLLFVEVAARLRDRLDADVAFAMIGAERGEIGERVRERIVSLGLLEQCKLLGARFPVEPLLSGFDVLLAPAVSEGFGRTLVEAMYYHVPVISADDGGHKEIIAHNKTGLLVPPDDADAFAMMAMRVLQDREFSDTLAENAYLEAQTRFSVHAHVTRVQAVYDSLVN